MAQKRRKCKLVNSDYSDIDLRQYSQIIINTIENTVPNKNPKVFKDYFSTDPITQGESVALGRELSKIPELNGFGKTITTFRLFDGRTYDSEDATIPSHAQKREGNDKTKIKGERNQ